MALGGGVVGVAPLVPVVVDCDHVLTMFKPESGVGNNKEREILVVEPDMTWKGPLASSYSTPLLCLYGAKQVPHKEAQCTLENSW